jgi:hypothetical protein
MSGIALGVFLTAATPARADRPFSPRYATTDRGQVTLVANTVETCPGNSSSCKSARDGTTATDNGLLPMGYVDVDSDSGTFDSSQANLALPAGTTVLWAGLYWAGDTSAGSFGSAAPTPGSRAQVRFATPSASYATVTAGVLDTDATATTRYQGFADVTSLVRSAGNGTYAVANVQSGTGGNRWGGWSLLVAYRDTSQPVRRLQVYDGFQALQSGGATSTDIAVTDLLTPATGTVRGRLGLLSWEGDRGSTGESATLGARALTDALNPVNDVFNSTIGRDGATVTTRNPSYVNTLGFDADELSIDGAVANGASSTTLHLTAAGDTYLPGALAVATDEGAPIARVAPAVGGTARDGQTLTADRGTWDGNADGDLRL